MSSFDMPLLLARCCAMHSCIFCLGDLTGGALGASSANAMPANDKEAASKIEQIVDFIRLCPSR